MEICKAAIIILDISGYTKFIRLHRISIFHAERIISRLMEDIIDHVEHPMIVNKLQGDSALIYVPTENEVLDGDHLISQIHSFIQRFNTKVEELANNNLCFCDGCFKVGHLKLKAIAHFGEIAIKKIRSFEEISGEDLIITHRLAKNSVSAKEYILVTDTFKQHLNLNNQDFEWEKRKEKAEGIGSIDVWVYYPEADEEIPMEKPSFMKHIVKGVGMMFTMMPYSIGRSIGIIRRRKHFDHLEI